MPHLEILKKYAIKHAVSFSDIKTNAIVEAMEEYAEQRIREELINYSNYYYCGFSQEEILHSTDEQLIDMYLKQRQK